MPRGRARMRRSEPKASAKNPRCSAATEKLVYSAGAPAKALAGAGCLPEAAYEAVDNAIRITAAANDRFIFLIGFLIRAYAARAPGLPAPPRRPGCRRA